MKTESIDDRRVRELAKDPEWRRAIEGLALSDDAAYVLRVRVLRERTFGAAVRGAARAGRRKR